MAIKKLQNDCTTSEQSKQLLELGIPADSANCYKIESELYDKGIRVRYSSYELNPEFFNVPNRIPIWSVGRLIEIYCTCRECTWEYITNNPPIQDILCDIELHIDDLDFSKLEEK